MIKKVFLILFFVLAVLSPVLANSKKVEVTLGFEWRNSDQNLGIIENYISDSWFPIFIVLKEEYFSDQWYDYYRRHSVNLDLVRKSTQFQKKASFVWGLDFPLYKGMTLGFEVNVGVLKREIKEVDEKIFVNLDAPDDPYSYHTKEERISREILAPINFFLNIKYKFEIVKVLRPYLGLGAGVATVLNLKDDLIGTKFLQLPDEKIGWRAAGIGMAGMDLWIIKKLAVFVEGRYNITDRGWAVIAGLRVR